MTVVALTGGIGAGKSLVAREFAQLGARVVDADQLSRAVIAPGEAGFVKVVESFGSEILENGDLNRQVLGRIVFGDAEARAKLESIIHPLVRAAFDQLVGGITPGEILIYEIPLLVETAARSRFDAVITIEADLALRRERLKIRGLSEADIEARIAAQASPQERMAIADYLLSNNGSPEQLLSEVKSVWEKLLAMENRKEGRARVE